MYSRAITRQRIRARRQQKDRWSNLKTVLWTCFVLALGYRMGHPPTGDLGVITDHQLRRTQQQQQLLRASASESSSVAMAEPQTENIGFVKSDKQESNIDSQPKEPTQDDDDHVPDVEEKSKDTPGSQDKKSEAQDTPGSQDKKSGDGEAQDAPGSQDKKSGGGEAQDTPGSQDMKSGDGEAQDAPGSQDKKSGDGEAQDEPGSQDKKSGDGEAQDALGSQDKKSGDGEAQDEPGSQDKKSGDGEAQDEPGSQDKKSNDSEAQDEPGSQDKKSTDGEAQDEPGSQDKKSGDGEEKNGSHDHADEPMKSGDDTENKRASEDSGRDPDGTRKSGDDKESKPEESGDNEDEEDSPFIDPNVPVADWDYTPDERGQSVKDPVLNLDPEKCSNLVVDRSPPKRRPPSNGACDGYDGVLHIKHGDVGAGSGTVFFLYMVGLLTWCEQHNYLPWVHMNDFSTKVYDKDVHTQGDPFSLTMMIGMEVGWAKDERDKVGYKFPGKPLFSEDVTELTENTYEFGGTGIWEHYFEPVSDFSPGDPSCADKPYLVMDDYHVMPGLHSHAPWAPHGWRYWMPPYIQQIETPLQEWFEPQREHGARITERYIRFNAEMEQRAACALPNPEKSMGLHIRHGDKGLEREVQAVSRFLPYVEVFIEDGGGSIYLATDSALVIEEIMRDWPEKITSHIVRQPSVEGLTRNETASFDIGISIHQSNVEALTDVLALSKCTYLVHGLSAFTEAAFFLNPELQKRALNLDDEDANLDVEHFKNVIIPNGKIPNWDFTDLSLPVANWDYFPEMKELSVKEPELNLDPEKCSSLEIDTSPPPKRPPSTGACEGYDGVVHIQQGDRGGASGAIFFSFIVGMLQWADQHNYKPWIHLNDFSLPVYDPVVHTQGENTKFSMMSGKEIGFARDPIDPFGYEFPGQPKMEEGEVELTLREYEFSGTGIWNHYFEPVSDFAPGDSSCENKPYVHFDISRVVPGIHSQAPYAPHAFRYWCPEHIRKSNITELDWFEPQRRHAAAVTKRYIRFTPEMEQRAACAHPRPENSMGMHIRHGDKWTTRNVIKVEDFLPYCEAFVDFGGGDIFLATDSQLVVDEIMRDWPERVRSKIVRQQAVEGLSRNETAAFELGVSKHKTNVEALTDALAMSKCTYLLHGLSALSEAAIYMNPGLIERSSNLEDYDVSDERQLKIFVNEVLPRGKNIAAEE